jgi:hypothetical protein
MTTLIIHKNANGKVTGRCDARCYNSKNPVCECICRGANHGVGFARALSNSKEMFDLQQPGDGLTFTRHVKQQDLFDNHSGGDGESTS